MHRREFCERVAMGAAAVTGASTLAGRGAARSRAGRPTTHPGSIPVVTTRGHFEVDFEWSFWDDGFYSDELVDEYNKYDYGVAGDLPWDADELVVVVHGWSNDPEGAADMFETTRQGVRSGGSDAPVVGFSYDASVDFLKLYQIGKWWAHYDVARRNGLKLASFVHDFAGKNSDATVRLVGHSLGAFPIVAATKALERVDTTVESAALLGGAVERNGVSLDGEYGKYVERNCESFHNYHKDDDLVLDTAFEVAQFDSAVGEEGAPDPKPGNYTDHDVSGTVSSHFEYNEPSGCMDQVVEDW